MGRWKNGTMGVGIVATCLLASSSAMLGQGQYSEVTAKDVVALQLNHYFTADKKGHQPEFTWTFTKYEFAIRAGEGGIPADLMKRLLPPGAKAIEIRGKWSLASNPGQITFSDILGTDASGGEVLGNKETKYHIYRTAPTVVRIGEPQYVFGVGL